MPTPSPCYTDSFPLLYRLCPFAIPIPSLYYAGPFPLLYSPTPSNSPLPYWLLSPPTLFPCYTDYTDTVTIYRLFPSAIYTDSFPLIIPTNTDSCPLLYQLLPYTIPTPSLYSFTLLDRLLPSLLSRLVPSNVCKGLHRQPWHEFCTKCWDFFFVFPFSVWLRLTAVRMNTVLIFSLPWGEHWLKQWPTFFLYLRLAHIRSFRSHLLKWSINSSCLRSAANVLVWPFTSV